MTMTAVNTPCTVSPYGPVLRVIRRSLDALYLTSGYLAAASMIAILVLTLAQIAGRWAGINLRGASDYAGYFMASAAFLAFGHALNAGSHIRIELFLSMLGRFRIIAETLALALSTAIAAWFAYHCCLMVYWSYKLGDISTGLDATPLWIPQSTMAVGSVFFAVAIADHFLRLVFTGAHGIPVSTEVE
jgi:TRAP-type C4-dicarboxylate transport system permease small subunit